MPSRAAIPLLTLLVTAVSGCSAWPTAEHRAVTDDSIRAIVNEAVQSQPAPVPECSGLESISRQLRRQKVTMEHMAQELQALTAANPSFANSDCPANTASDTLDGRTLVGSSEWIYISPPGHHYKARIDSGAATSSISAKNIERFERNGEKWVRFDLQHDDEAEPIPVEAPLVRHVRIRQASTDETDRRPVVSLTVNLGNNLQQDTEFSLTDRSQMNYPILLGRSFLRDVTLIDVGQRFVQPRFEPDKVKQDKPAADKVPAKAPEKTKAPEKAKAAEKTKAAEPEAKKAVPEESAAAAEQDVKPQQGQQPESSGPAAAVPQE